jgi:flagellar motor switch protein FliN/FliY
MIETRSVEAAQSEGLIGTWSRAVEQVFERLTKAKSQLQWARQQSGSSENLATLEWWEAKYEAESAHCVWIGIAGPAAVEIGSLAQAIASAGSGQPGAQSFSAEQTVEALCQAFATMLAEESGKDVRFQGVKRLDAAPAAEVLYSTELTLTPGPAAPMLVGFQAATNSMFQRLTGESPGQGAKQSASQANSPLGLLLDLELPLSVRFGRVNMPLESVLELRPGSVVELDGSQEDHVDLLVNGSLVAKGEVVAVDGHYAIRILNVLSRDCRMAGVSPDPEAN